MAGGGLAITTHDDIEKQVIPCGVSQAAPLFPVANGSLIMPFQVDPNGSLFVNQQGTVPADAITPGAQPVDSTSYMMVWNGISWDRVKSIPDNANGQAALVSGLPGVVARLQGYDPLLGNWNRVQVSNDNTDAQIPSATGHVAAIAHNMVFNGSTWDRERASNKFNSGPAISIGHGIANEIWQPAAGKKFRLLGFTLTLTENASVVGGGIHTVQFYDGANPMPFLYDVYLPGTALLQPGTCFNINVELGPIGYLSSAINNILSIDLSSALASGQWRVNLRGTEE